SNTRPCRFEACANRRYRPEGRDGRCRASPSPLLRGRRRRNAELQQVAVRVGHVEFAHAPYTVGDLAQPAAVVRSGQGRVQRVNVVDPEIGRCVLGDAPFLAGPEMDFDVVAADDGKTVLGVETTDRETELVPIPPRGLVDVGGRQLRADFVEARHSPTPPPRPRAVPIPPFRAAYSR